MPNQTISNLDPITTPSDASLVWVADPEASPQDRKWSLTNLWNWVLGKDSIRWVDSVADLKAVTPRTGLTVCVRGYYARGDGGGGPARYGVTGASPGTYTDNGGSVIVPTGGDGSAAWLWAYVGPVDPRWFGATGNGTDDDTVAVNYCIQNFTDIHISDGDYLVDYLDFSGRSKMAFRGDRAASFVCSGLNKQSNLDGDTVFAMIGTGTGGTGGTHPATTTQLLLDGLVLDADGQTDIVVYCDYMTDSEISRVALKGSAMLISVNYSWIDIFRELVLTGDFAYGMNIGVNNINDITVIGCRATTTNASGICYKVYANSIDFIQCTGEGAGAGFSVSGGMVSLYACHFESEIGVTYATIQSLSLIACAFFGVTSPLLSTNTAVSLVIIGCYFRTVTDPCEVVAVEGIIEGNGSDGSDTWTLDNIWKGKARVANGLPQTPSFDTAKRFRLTTYTGTLSTSSGSPTTIATLPFEGTVNMGGTLTVIQRLSSSNAAIVKILLAWAEDGTLNQAEIKAASTAIGLVVTSAVSGSTILVKAYATQASPIMATFDMTRF